MLGRLQSMAGGMSRSALRASLATPATEAPSADHSLPEASGAISMVHSCGSLHMHCQAAEPADWRCFA